MDRFENPLVKCPFDPVHRVLRSRLQAHIVKCEKNHPGFIACPYNATHRFKPADLRQHVANCPSRDPINPADIPPKVIADVRKSAPLNFTLAEDDSDYECWD